MKLLSKLDKYIAEVALELAAVPANRVSEIERLAESIKSTLRIRDFVNLSFICTHNSRRSHIAQVWAGALAVHFGFDEKRIRTFSGGTVITVPNVRVISGLRRAGFEVDPITCSKGPAYLVTFAPDYPPIKLYSKLYDDPSNPKQDFYAIITCQEANKACPAGIGTDHRSLLKYEDPQRYDDTPLEDIMYDKCIREIGREMYLLMSKVRVLIPDTRALRTGRGLGKTG
ncbi:arsenate reductase (plasmid) [Fulvitalea axinellae]|uniref:Arsenate reductase n=1 Tax=Fulvitalea axinellae TaxID=1182444 RepID=A0AAU9DA18_9BACT|nr:arsenate reductase [Fulvitalea axinellae]